MPEYVIFLHRVTDSPDFTREIVEKHCRHLAKLAAGGRFVAGGPFADEKDGGMIIGLFDSVEEASRFAKDDPFVVEGYETAEVRRWELARPENGFLGTLEPFPGGSPWFLETLRLRATTRTFSAKPISEELLRALLEAALSAPSEFNLQPWRPVVCHDRENRERLSRCCFGQPQVAAAGAAVVCAVDPAVFHEEAPRAVDETIAAGRVAEKDREARIAFVRSFYPDPQVAAVRNATIFGHQLLLAGLSRGLQGYWLGGFDLNALRREFDLPERAVVGGVVGLGWPEEYQHPLPRRAYEDVVALGRWGRPR